LNIVAASDVFASASIKGESITKSIIEAMSLEVTPIITDIPGNVELCDHEDSGLVVKMKNPKELSDAILRLYNDRALCEKLAKNAKARIGSFLNTDRSIKEMKEFYDELMAE
jgi:L-malate glycosyltransferase